MYILYLPLSSYWSILHWHSAKRLITVIQYFTWRHIIYVFTTGINFILILFKEVPTYEPKSAVQNLYIFVKLDIYCKDRFIHHSAEQNLVPQDSMKNMSSFEMPSIKVSSEIHC